MEKNFKQKVSVSDVRRSGHPPVGGLRRRTSKNSFQEKVLLIVSKIPKGKTMSYQQVAIKAGNPRAARAVGTIMKSNFDPKVPCHRVIRSDGEIGDYNRGGPKQKAKLLQQEGALQKIK